MGSDQSETFCNRKFISGNLHVLSLEILLKYSQKLYHYIVAVQVSLL